MNGLNRTSVGRWLSLLWLVATVGADSVSATTMPPSTVARIRRWCRSTPPREVAPITEKPGKQDAVIEGVGSKPAPPKEDKQPKEDKPPKKDKPPQKDKDDQSQAQNSVTGNSELQVAGDVTTMLALTDGRLFYASGASLAYQKWPNGTEVQLPLPAFIDGKRVELKELLAAKSSDKGVLLVVYAGQPGQSSTGDLFEITVEGDKVVQVVPALDRLEYEAKTAEAFLAQFQTPRCHLGGTTCLRRSDDEGIVTISIESHSPDLGSGKRPTIKPWMTLGRQNIRDVAWAPDGKTLLLLRTRTS